MKLPPHLRFALPLTFIALAALAQRPDPVAEPFKGVTTNGTIEAGLFPIRSTGVTTAPVPYVAPKDQITVQSYGYGIFNVRAQYGFMQDPNVPEALAAARDQGVELDPADIIYFLGRETIIVTERAGMAVWREKLFVLMARNAVRATAFFRLPPERVVELGVQVEM